MRDKLQKERFPSPVGELCFSIYGCLDIYRIPHRFRPLSGSYVSQLSEHSHKRINRRRSFLPLSGSYVSQSKRTENSAKSGLVSVPCRGAMFLNSEPIIVKAFDSLFPSPVGELCFSIICKNIHRTCIRCFRPLSGSYVSQCKHSYRRFKAGKEFPSPVGELCFSIFSGNEYRRPFSGFRPLSGSYVSQF